MPVFTRLRDDVMTLTVDGDYTANELRRVAFNAFESVELPTRLLILLDMSGAVYDHTIYYQYSRDVLGLATAGTHAPSLYDVVSNMWQ